MQTTPTKTRNSAETWDSTMYMLNTLNTSRNQPNLHILDNETSSSLRQGLLNNKSKYQLSPLHLHRGNAAECAIQKFKAHFITCLCEADTRYPEKEWDNFLLQEKFTINLLHNYRFNTKLSAHAALHGIFDYKKTPLAPLGTIILFHDNKSNLRTWTKRGTYGWYIGTSLEHYQCVECYIPSTHITGISDTVELISTVIPIPKTSSEDYLCQSITYILSLLADPKPTVPYI